MEVYIAKKEKFKEEESERESLDKFEGTAVTGHH